MSKTKSRVGLTIVKLTYNEMMNCASSIQRLWSIPLPPLTALSVRRNIRELRSQMEGFDEMFRRIFTESVKLDDKGNPVLEKDEKGNPISGKYVYKDEEKYKKELEELGEQTASLSIKKIDPKEIKTNLEPSFFEVLDWLFTDDE